MLLNKELDIIFEKLLNALNKTLIYNNSTNKQELTNIIDELINLYSKEINENIIIVHEDKKAIKAIDKNALMFNLGDEIHYSTDLIIENLIDRKRNITYALTLINCIYHETTHCKQNKDNQRVNITFQNYLNQLAILLANCNIIEYVDRPYEGEAYGAGANRTLKYIQDKDSIINKLYKNYIYEETAESLNFKRNLEFHKLMYNLNKIPYFYKDNQFQSIIQYINKLLTSIDKRILGAAYNFCPMGIMLGINQDGSLKDPYTLMNTYFEQTLKYGFNNFNLNEKSLNELTKIYIHILIPQINPYIYKNLYKIYGEDKMNYFTRKIIHSIEKNKIEFEKARSNSLKNLKHLDNFSSLDRVDKDYINQKASTGINNLEQSLYTIKNCKPKRKKVLKRRPNNIDN